MPKSDRIIKKELDPLLKKLSMVNEAVSHLKTVMSGNDGLKANEGQTGDVC